MKNTRLYISFIWIILFIIQVPSVAQIKLPSLVSDGMILQRGEKVKVWGWASPGEKVTVNFLNKTYKATTDENGNWQLVLDELKAGGPYEMELKASNSITLHNILIGDVWVCSGQSNMTHYFGRHRERYAKEIAESKNSEIRQFYVPTTAVLTGPADDVPGSKWVEATPGSIIDFTVIGYFFVKKLYDTYHVPMGIINTCVGGTIIEAWTSENGFKEFPDIEKNIEKNKDTAYVNGVNREARASMMAGGPRKETDKGLTGDVKWFNPAYKPLNWKRINIPGYWEDQGIRDLDGVVWYRRVINVPKLMTGCDAMVKLGRIVNADELYINGQSVGKTTYEYPQREYKIKAGVLKPGNNLFVVRVMNQYGKGGFVPDKPYFLLAANDTVDLKGDWYYKVGDVYQHDKHFKHGIFAQNEPTSLYNGMIAPLTKYAVRGFLWYQGESNAGNPQPYKKYLTDLISDWRNQWQLGDLSFLIAQLPNYMDVNYLPEDSNWALIREAELQVSQEVPNTGLDVNIDLGEWNDIHPGNKKPVGERLALAAMKLTYGDKDDVTSGPIFKSQRIEGNKIILTFDNVGGGLVSGNGEDLSHFAIAGADKKFVWGTTKIVNDEVVVSNDEVPNPKYVRYAWADNPDFANLYNKEGLPASPFRTDK